MLGFDVSKDLRDVMHKHMDYGRIYTNKTKFGRSVKCYLPENPLKIGEMITAVYKEAFKIPGVEAKIIHSRSVCYINRSAIIVHIPKGAF